MADEHYARRTVGTGPGGQTTRSASSSPSRHRNRAWGRAVDVSEYLGLFLDESRENLQALNASLLALEREPDDREPLTVVFRVAHSLKGMSATMGFTAMAGLTHRMEEVLTDLRDGGAPITRSVTDALFACLDTLQEMVDRVESGDGGDVETTTLLARLEAVVGGEAHAGASDAAPPAAAQPGAASATGLTGYERVVIEQAAAQGLSVLAVHVELADDCVLRAARAFMVVSQLENHGDIVRSVPGTEEIERDEIPGALEFWVATAADADTVHAAATSVSEVASAQVEAVDTAGDGDAPQATDEAPAEGASSEDAAQEAAGAAAPPAGDGARPAQRAAATVRVGTDRLDGLMNLMGEMVIVRTRLARLAGMDDTAGVRAAVQDLGRVTGDLQSLVMRVRMMPIETVFMRFPRMVRDLAHSLGKEVDLRISGEDTELDRTVIDELGDPLVHMLRNAVDHGLESTQQRLDAGKPATGTVCLEARHAGSSVVIEVRDDGRGMDPAALREQAVRKGLLTPERAAAMGDADALELVMLPGFSTAEATTDISGRGVGMDAVRARILSLGGSVEISSVPGEGTTFTVRLPLTLAIIGALLVNAGGETYAIQIEAIEEIVTVGADGIRNAGDQPCMLLRDQVVPIVWLRERLQIDGGRDDRDSLEVVVTNSGSGRVGVVVDGLIGQQDVVIKQLPDYLGDVLGVAGATILGDGSVALIVDLGSLVPAASAVRA